MGTRRAFCRRLRDLRQGDRIVVGMRGIRVTPESKERDRLSFAFMANGISSERQVETAVRQTAAALRKRPAPVTVMRVPPAAAPIAGDPPRTAGGGA